MFCIQNTIDISDPEVETDTTEGQDHLGEEDHLIAEAVGGQGHQWAKINLVGIEEGPRGHLTTVSDLDRHPKKIRVLPLTKKSLKNTLIRNERAATAI